jgi:Putative transposase
MTPKLDTVEYLGRYVNRRAIGDSRILSVTDAKQIQRIQMPSFFWFFICVNLGLSAVKNSKPNIIK